MYNENYKNTGTPEEIANRSKYPNLLRLVTAYRTHGHRLASLDPLDLTPQDGSVLPELDPARYGLYAGDTFDLAGILSLGENVKNTNVPLESVIQHLSRTYIGRIGFEFTHTVNNFNMSE
jgi:probable 2-oxoglutarate dehydrogenase E1 component DHKTD1